MIASPQNVQMLGTGLDHPECVCVAPDGALYAGGEGGQLYRLAPDGTQSQAAGTGGFLLGVALDGHGRVHACDAGRKAVLRIDPDGPVTERAGGFEIPNYGVFDAAGNLFVSDSGDYWNPTGTGKVYVDYKDVETLKRLLSINGKILSRNRSGAAAFEQRMITDAIKRARFLALLPYSGPSNPS